MKKQDGNIQSVAFSPDGNSLLTGCDDGSTRVWDATTGQELVRLGGHTGGIRSALFSPDGQTIVTGSYDGTVRLWNVAEMMNEGFAQDLGEYPSPINSLASTPDGKLFVTGENGGSVRLCNAATGKELWLIKRIYNPGKFRDAKGKIQTSTSSFCSVAFSPDGKKILVGSGIDCVARIYDVALHKETGKLKGHKDYVASVAFSPDSKLIATGGGDWDETVFVWNANTGRKLWKFKGHGEVAALAFASDSKRLLTANKHDGTDATQIWDTVTGRVLLALNNNKKAVRSAAFSPDGKRILTGDGLGKAVVWDATTGKKLLQLQGHKEPINAVAYSPDGKRIATASLDNTARLWDATTGNELLRFTTPSTPGGINDVVSAVCFSPDGKQLYTGHGNGVTRIWRKMNDLQIATVEKLHRQVAALRQENEAILHLEDAPLEVILQNAQTILSKRPDQTRNIASRLNSVVWKVVDPANPIPTLEKAQQALLVAEKMIALTNEKDSSYGPRLDTLAAAQFACGDLESAVQTERKAVQVLGENNKDDIEEMRAQLAKYEELLAEKQKGKR